MILKIPDEMKAFNGKTLTDTVIICLALLSITMHLLFINNLEYHRDELLYFSLGLHPAAGYATVPLFLTPWDY